VIKLKKILSESYAWERKFGEPLPTLTDIMNKKDCDCGGSCCEVKEVVSEGPDDVRRAKKELQRVMKVEAKLRERMLKLEQIFLQDPRPENQKLAKDIKKSYKDNVTKFMRDTISYVKKMK
jgi:hypothetical protein